MPQKSNKICPRAGCNRVIPGQETGCFEHKKKPFEGKKIIPEHEAFYKSRQWLRLRKQFLNRYPFCTECKKEKNLVPAQVVDHIIPLQKNYLLRWTWSNLQGLCIRHHNQKTGREGGKNSSNQI